MSQRAILMVSCALLVSACATQGLERADRSTLNPPVIGGPDILRDRAMPPATPSDVRLPTASVEGGSGELTAIRSNGLRISEIPDRDFTKSRTAVSVIPGQLGGG